MFKMVTFNIRCDYGQDGDNNFEYRKPFILEKLNAEKPDIICFQEVLPHVAVWLKEVLADYYVVGCGRSDTLEDEQVSVAYLKARMNLISMETFWLSPTPYAVASRYDEQSACPRVCTEAVFEDLKEKQVFRLMNFHLDHMGTQARELGLGQIVKKAEETDFFAEVPVILAGDFNAEPGAPEMKQMERWPGYRFVTEKIGVTYHGFLPEDGMEAIDHIFLRDGEKTKIRCVSLDKWEDKRGNLWLSDHYPICTMLAWEKQ